MENKFLLGFRRELQGTNSFQGGEKHFPRFGVGQNTK